MKSFSWPASYPLSPTFGFSDSCGEHLWGLTLTLLTVSSSVVVGAGGS